MHPPEILFQSIAGFSLDYKNPSWSDSCGYCSFLYDMSDPRDRQRLIMSGCDLFAVQHGGGYA